MTLVARERPAILNGMKCFVAAIVFALPLLASAAGTSLLWGEHGESWQPNGRLPDFSYAGYHRGEAPIPSVAQTASVKDFGAVGDGVADDTHAIQAAIDATPHGAVWLPPGRYKITDYIWIRKPGIALRGAGADKSVLWFPRGLDEIHPREMHESRGLPTSGYSFDGAFVAITGDYRARPIAHIVATAKRGDRSVEVDSAEALRPGQLVFVQVHEDAAQSLKQYLYSGDAGDISHGKKLGSKLLAHVVAITGNRVKLDRPLRFETRSAWTPTLDRFSPTVTESGIEDLGFDFPARKYAGHFKENGANAIELREVSNCWVKNVRIHNADMGFTIVGCQNTVDGVVITADAARETKAGTISDCTGHHAFQCKFAEDNLVEHFDIETCYVHDLSVEHASGNVYANGRGRDVCFDHHEDTPYDNLYTAIDCGRATRVWASSGGAGLGRHSASGETFWNITGRAPIGPPPKGWGPKTMNFVGIASKTLNNVEAFGAWWEGGGPVEPRDLHAAQLRRRLAAK